MDEPSSWIPMSTKAPKSTTFLTAPSAFGRCVGPWCPRHPVMKNFGASKESLKSRPGLSKSAIISLSFSSLSRSVAKLTVCTALIWAGLFIKLPISRRLRALLQPCWSSGWTPVLSYSKLSLSGDTQEITRPPLCSKALRPDVALLDASRPNQAFGFPILDNILWDGFIKTSHMSQQGRTCGVDDPTAVGHGISDKSRLSDLTLADISAGTDQPR